MRALERFMLLQIIDERWREHLHDMDYLREGIHLRGFAQIDPLVAYKNEGFTMFTELMNNIWEEFARYIFNVEVEVEGGNGAGPEQAPAAAVGHRRQHQLHRLLPLRRRHGRRPAQRAGRSGRRGRRRAVGRRAARSSMRRAGRDRAAGRRGEHRPQRPVLVRLGQEVQEVPWRIAPTRASATS